MNQVLMEEADEGFLQALYHGSELIGQGALEEARQALQVAVSMRPRDAKARNLLGLACFKMGDYVAAESLYQALVDENVNDPTLRVNLGLVHLKTGRFEEAIRELSAAVELQPDHRRAQNYLGLAYARVGDYAQAQECFVLAGSDQMVERMERLMAGEVVDDATGELGGFPPPEAASNRGHVERQNGPSSVTVYEEGQAAPDARDYEPSQAHQDVAQGADGYETAPYEEHGAGPDYGYDPANEHAYHSDSGEANHYTDESSEHVSHSAPVGEGGEEGGQQHHPSEDEWAGQPPQGEHEEDWSSVDASISGDQGPYEGSKEGFDDPSVAVEYGAGEVQGGYEDFDVSEGAANLARGAPQGFGEAETPTTRPSVPASSPPPRQRWVLPARLLELADRVALPGEVPATFAVSEDLVVAAVDREILSRVSGLIAFDGSLTLKPEVKRFRGRATDRPFGEHESRMLRVSGQGRLYIAARGRCFTPIRADGADAYLCENSLFAFEETVSYENGRIPSKVSPDLNLVHLRGQGAVLLETPGRVASVTVKPGQVIRVPLERLVGWTGLVTPRVVSFADDGGVDGPLAGVELAGEGRVLLAFPAE